MLDRENCRHDSALMSISATCVVNMRTMKGRIDRVRSVTQEKLRSQRSVMICSIGFGVAFILCPGESDR